MNNNLEEDSTMGIVNRRKEDKWTVDKHIPIAVILAILGQSIVGIWWVSGLSHSVQDHERRLIAQESTKVAERLAVVEAQTRYSQELQIEINRKMDQLIYAKSQKTP